MIEGEERKKDWSVERGRNIHFASNIGFPGDLQASPTIYASRGLCQEWNEGVNSANQQHVSSILHIGFGLTLSPILEYSKFYIRERNSGCVHSCLLYEIQYITTILHNLHITEASAFGLCLLLFLPSPFVAQLLLPSLLVVLIVPLGSVVLHPL
jgi:hypothetical protein